MHPELQARLSDVLVYERKALDVLIVRGDEIGREDLALAAVERWLTIIGEALGVAFREEPLIDEWINDVPRIIGLRNILVHAYQIVSPLQLAELRHEYLPRPLREVEALIGGDDF